MKELDINVDIGEGFNIEAEIMPLIQSCNIACGGHAGNNKEMSKLISLARQRLPACTWDWAIFSMTTRFPTQTPHMERGRPCCLRSMQHR